MFTTERFITKKDKIAIIGLGYVGLPLAVAFAKYFDVIAYDFNSFVIESYKKGKDLTHEVGDEILAESSIYLTDDEADLAKAKFFVIAVPTPINKDKTPNLKAIIDSSNTVARYLLRGSIVVYESTVYPGLTEEVCLPILEEISGLKLNKDFKLGYSPERINPGDQTHRLENIVKVVSGSDEEALNTISKIYETIISAGVYRAKSIRTAEAAKVIENSQRDINIAFVNELSIIFNKLGLNTKDVLETAGSKWNFLNFKPGLVGGHCIGVDPYYLTYKAQQEGLSPKIILAGRSINDNMGKYVAENIVKLILKHGFDSKKVKIGIFGFTFKENCADIRNTKVMDIIDELKLYGLEPLIHDPIASPEIVKSEYQLKLNHLEEMTNLNVAVISVAHEDYKSKLSLDSIFDKNYDKILIDLKSIFNDGNTLKEYIYWSL